MSINSLDDWGILYKCPNCNTFSNTVYEVTCRKNNSSVSISVLLISYIGRERVLLDMHHGALTKLTHKVDNTLSSISSDFPHYSLCVQCGRNNLKGNSKIAMVVARASFHNSKFTYPEEVVTFGSEKAFLKYYQENCIIDVDKCSLEELITLKQAVRYLY